MSGTEKLIEVIPLSWSPFDYKSDVERIVKDWVPYKLKLFGLYGDSGTCTEALCEHFQQSIINLPDEPCLLLAIEKNKALGALIYSTGKKEIFAKPFVNTSEPIFYLRLISRFCRTIIACLSESTIDAWYYSEEVLLKNPFMEIFKEISHEVRQSCIYSYDRNYIVENSFSNLSDVWFGEEIAYTYTEPNLDPEALSTLQQRSNDFCLEVCGWNFKFEDLKMKFDEYLDSVEKYLVNYNNVCNIVFLDIKNLVIGLQFNKTEAFRKMAEGILNKFILQGFEINENKKGFTGSSFSDGTKSFTLQVVEKHLSLGCKDVIDIFNKECFEFVTKSEPARKLRDKIIKEYWNIAEEEVKKLESSAKFGCSNLMKNFESLLIKQKFLIHKYVPSVSKKISFKLNEPALIFKEKEQLGKLTAIIELNHQAILLILEDQEKKEATLMIQEENKHTKAANIKSVGITVAKLSNLTEIIVIDSQNSQLHLLKKKGSEYSQKTMKLDITIYYPHYLKKSNTLLFLNSEGILKSHTPYKENSYEDFDLSSFSSNLSNPGESYLALSISQEENIMCLLKAEYIVFFEFTTLTVIKLSLESSLNNISIISMKDSLYIMAFNQNMLTTHKIDKIFTDKSKQALGWIGNPTIDAFYTAVTTNNGSPLCNQFYIFTRNLTSPEIIGKYYQNLPFLSSLVSFKGVLSSLPSELNYQEQIYSSFIQTLFSLLPRILCKTRPFTPFQMSREGIEYILSLDPHPTLVQSVSVYITFGYIEEILTSLEEVFVISIYGEKEAHNKSLAYNLLGVDTEISNGDSISMHLTKVKDRDIVLFIYKIDSIEMTNDSRQCISLLNSVSDYIICRVSPNKVKDSGLLLTKIAFCDKLINDDFLYKYHLNLMIFPVIDSFTFADSSEDLPIIHRDFTHSALITPESHLFNAEKQLILNEILSKPSRWTGGSLCSSIKLIASQIYLQDSHPLEYWTSTLEDQTCLDCSEPGVCDTSVAVDKQSSISIVEKKLRLSQGHQFKDILIHRCDESCMFCDGLCELEFGHIGLHSLKMHRNSGKCSVKCFNQIVFSSRDQRLISEDSLKNDWHQAKWETPWESVFGLENNIIAYKNSLAPKRFSFKGLPKDQNRCIIS